MIAQAVAPASMDPAFIVMSGLTTLSTFVLLGFKVFDWFTGRATERKIQQPLRIIQDPQALSKAEHVEHCGHMERRMKILEARSDHHEDQMRTDKQEIIQSSEQRLILVHNRINDIDRKVSALDERTNTTNSTLTLNGQKLDRIAERLRVP